MDETITVQFQYTDISTTNADYGTPTGSINIPQNTAMSILQLPITDDNIAESDEVLLITATPPKLPDSYQNCATEVVIKDNDLAVSIAAGEAVTEGATAAFTVTRSASQPTTLTVALNVSETGNFIAPENEGSVEISIAANQTTATFYVPTVDDTVIESRGQITVALADNPLGYKKGTPDTASLSINDNDPTVTISAGEAVTEGASVSFTVTRNAPQATPLEVFVDISESTGDFVSAANEGRKMITIATNQSSADYAIPTVEDDVSELKGQVTVALAEPTNAGDYYIGIPDTTTLTVYDNDCRYADDVDQDDDGLIEICDVNALDAIRYQLDGSGYQENMNVAENRQGCGADDSGICIGYELVKDLDFTADASYRNPSNPLNKNIWTNGAGWSPIGDASNAFTAIFEGNGHTISNFRINNNAMDYIGLFAKTSQSAKINRLVLSQVTISGRAMVGSLVGLNEGIISNIDVIGGSLTATGNNTGGLVAKNDGVIFNSRVALESVTGADNVGGLIGNNTAQVIDSFAFGTVTGTGTRVGDLIGLDEGQPFAVPEEKSLLHDLTISAETNVVLSPPFDPFIFDYKIIAEAERSTNILLKAAPSISRSINLDGTAETQTIISVGSGASESRYRFTAHYATIAISPDSVQADEGSSVSLTASHDLNLSDVSYSYNWFEKGGSSLNLADVTTTKNTLTFTVPADVVPRYTTNTLVTLVMEFAINGTILSSKEVPLTVNKFNNDDGSKYELSTSRDNPTSRPNTYKLTLAKKSGRQTESDVDEDGGFAEGFTFPLIRWQRRPSGSSNDNDWKYVSAATRSDRYTIPYDGPSQYRAEGRYEDGQGYTQFIYSPIINYSNNQLLVISGVPANGEIDEGGNISLSAGGTLVENNTGEEYRWSQVSGKQLPLGDDITSADLTFTIPDDFVGFHDATSKIVLELAVSKIGSQNLLANKEIPLTINKVDNGVSSGTTIWISDTTLSAPDLNDVDGNPITRDVITYQWRTKSNGSYSNILDSNSKTYTPSPRGANTIYQVNVRYRDEQNYWRTVEFADAKLFSEIENHVDRDGDGLIEIWYLEELNAIRHQPDGSGYKASSGATKVTTGCPTPQGMTQPECNGYELTRDLDFQDAQSYRQGTVNSGWATGTGWIGIAGFNSTFDGNGHTISNLRQGTGRRETGLFYTTVFRSNTLLPEIKRIGLIDVDINTARSSLYTGGLVSSLEEGIISDSYVTGTISNSASGNNLKIGGLVGVMDPSFASIKSCYSEVHINVTGNGYDVGGLVGESGDIEDSYATGNVTQSISIGGNPINMNTQGGGLGGLVGSANGEIKNSYASGDVTFNGTIANEHVVFGIGGLVGVSSGIENSYASGRVTTGEKARVVGKLSLVQGRGVGIGGLAGLHNRLERYISYSYASGNVETTIIDNAGGLVGLQDIGDIRNSYASGNVIGGKQVGGLVGLQDSQPRINNVIENSFATGNVEGNEDVGGLVGKASGTIKNSYANGEITGKSKAGGLVGLIEGGISRIEDSYAIGSVASSGAVGGLVNTSSSTIIRSYWATDKGGDTSDDTDATNPNYKGFTSEQLRQPTTAGVADGDPYYQWDDDKWDFGTGTEYPALKYDDASCSGTDPSSFCGKLLPRQRFGLRDLILTQNYGSEAVELSPSFDPTITDYMVTAHLDATGLTITPIAADPDVRIVVGTTEVLSNQSISLTLTDPDIITIEVSQADATGSEERIRYHLLVNTRRYDTPLIPAFVEGDNGRLTTDAKTSVDFLWTADEDSPTTALGNKILESARLSGASLEGRIETEGTIALPFMLPDDLIATDSDGDIVNLILTVRYGDLVSLLPFSLTIRKKNNGSIFGIGSPTQQAFSYKVPSIDLSLDTDGAGLDDSINYQWQRQLGDEWSDIPDATEQIYTIEGLVGDRYRVLISYTDGQGYAERRIPSQAVIASADAIYDATAIQAMEDAVSLTRLSLSQLTLSPGFQSSIKDYRSTIATGTTNTGVIILSATKPSIGSISKDGSELHNGLILNTIETSVPAIALNKNGSTLLTFTLRNAGVENTYTVSVRSSSASVRVRAKVFLEGPLQ
ncbi:MAG: cadherin-like beta sandwich domain-containing protein [Gammaproteobacteria bacterium]|nr:cadherin-like beta sandwich domain-containing protein [Gammaproteobacteria bacterium]